MNSGLLHTMQAFASSLSLRVLAPGEVLFEAGETGATIFCVLSGAVELDWGGDVPELFGPGEVLGVGALVSDNHRRHGTARALEPTELIELGREQFLFAVQETPMFAIELMASLERRLRGLEE
jgi:CRP/FNR family cyclic AMP-dependent transcriptional regulator